jgi:cellulose synthase/poly-beta-1,6-N-acetylglucosamine synthase-like glycosyltransferase
VAPLAEPGVGASTGYRWYAPEPPGFWTLLRSVWDAASYGLMGPGDNRFAWGGATAIRKETFFEARIPAFWSDAVSDDYALSRAIHEAGLTIAYAPGALTPSRERASAWRTLSWMRRQMMITRAYSPRLWWMALIAHAIYCGGMAASIVGSIQGDRLAEWALIAQLSPGMLKGMNRATLAKASAPELDAWFKRHHWVHALWVPLATWLWLGVLAASAAGRTIVWRGRRYRL